MCRCSVVWFQLTKSESVLSEKIETYTQSVEGKAMFCIVREFLEFFNLDFTIAVYESESCMGARYKYDGKFGIIKDLGVSQLDENSQGPLLLQLIRLVQLNNNTISKSDFGDNCASGNSEVDSDGNTKTEILTTNTENGEMSATASKNIHTDEEIEEFKKANLDATFNLSNPKVMLQNGSGRSNTDSDKEKSTVEEKSNGCLFSHPSTQNDEIHNVTTVKESKDDEENSSDTAKSNASLSDTYKQKTTTEENNSDLEFPSPVLKDAKFSPKSDIAGEKLKLSSQKPDKLKPKTNLNSLADLPPIQVSKARPNDPMILPSLYSHEFKEKANLKELDELLGLELDSMDNYEEDFMSASEVELSAERYDLSAGVTDKRKDIKTSEGFSSTTRIGYIDGDIAVRETSEDTHT